MSGAGAGGGGAPGGGFGARDQRRTTFKAIKDEELGKSAKAEWANVSDTDWGGKHLGLMYWDFTQHLVNTCPRHSA
jgi:hypothetical protein